ncbi:MAG TPA: glycosyltransferase family 39 protein [Candidatus Saccharimonadales bacterium]|nr:glycosyltransferase family 39 protein [Candidatus Saccharimonadales bacterium]
MISRLLARLPFIKKTSWAERHFIGVLVIGSLVAATMSLLIGLHQSVWFDEAYSILLAKQPLDRLVYLASVDTHPPLYYILLKGWAALFGWGELALRSLSVLAMSAAVIFAGLFVRRTFGARVALVALPFVVFAPFILRYGFEIRMYALASLIGIAATYVLVRAMQATGKKQWLLYGLYAVLVAAGVYTLYYLALLWIAHFVWLISMSLKTKRSIIKSRWLLAYVGSVVLFLPWLPTFLAQVNNGALAAISQPLTLINLLGIVSFNFVYQPAWQLGAVVSLLVVFVIVAVTYFAVKAYKTVSAAQRPYLVLLAAYLAVPVAVLTLVSLNRPMYVERYLAHIAIGGMLFVGVTIALAINKKSFRQAKKMWIIAGLLFATLLVGTVHLAQVGNYNFQRMQTPTIEQTAAAIAPCDDQTSVVAADPYVAIELMYYLPDCQIYFYSETVALGGGYAPLSNSPLHVTNPVGSIGAADTLFYIYYGEPKLVLPTDFRSVSQQSFEALHIQKFSAE